MLSKLNQSIEVIHNKNWTLLTKYSIILRLGITNFIFFQYITMRVYFINLIYSNKPVSFCSWKPRTRRKYFSIEKNYNSRTVTLGHAKNLRKTTTSQDEKYWKNDYEDSDFPYIHDLIIFQRFSPHSEKRFQNQAHRFPHATTAKTFT